MKLIVPKAMVDEIKRVVHTTTPRIDDVEVVANAWMPEGFMAIDDGHGNVHVIKFVDRC